MRWTVDQIPDQTGRTAIITGANSGIGYWMTRYLAEKGARVLMACRGRERALEARSRILKVVPEAQIEILDLDLASLASIHKAAKTFHQENDELDLLINNAGVMMTPRWKTEDGFEYQFGINHLGHFALTNLLLPALERTPESRIVSLSSIAHRSGRIYLDDLNWEKRRYSRWKVYSQTKLANLMFAMDLNRRLQERGSNTCSLAAHPGISRTNLGRDIPGGGFAFLFGQPPRKGALPALRAATDPEATSHPYWGPRGPMEAIGYPKKARPRRKAFDEGVAESLWRASESLTGITFPEASD